MWPRASESTIRKNCVEDPRPVAVVKRTVRNESVAKARVKKEYRGRYFVRYTRVAHRLLDDDNPCSKFHTDILRYASILPDDAPGQTTITTGQRKAEKGEQEHTLIEVSYLP